MLLLPRMLKVCAYAFGIQPVAAMHCSKSHVVPSGLTTPGQSSERRTI